MAPPEEAPAAPRGRQQALRVVVIVVGARGGHLRGRLLPRMLVAQRLLERIRRLVQPERVLLAGHRLEEPGEHRVHGQPGVRRHGSTAARACRLPLERKRSAMQAERVAALQGDGPRQELEADRTGEHVLRKRGAAK